MVAVFLYLVAGFWELQVRNPEFYSEQADRNRIKALPIPAPRGKILDRDGRVIVDNHSSFSLILSRENLKQGHIGQVAEGLRIDYEELTAQLKRFASRPRYQPIIIKEELTGGEVAFVEAHRGVEGFPEMELIHAQRRLYPRNGVAAHVIGYTGEVSEAELNTADFARYNQGDVIGKAGVERQYNEILTGVDGQRQVLVDSRGSERHVLGLKEAVPGKSLRLTIDLDLQTVAELAMEGRRGAVVALDPRNGEVLAMVSQPAFDPGLFAGRIRASNWQEITNNPENPLLNRAIQAQLAPGSTFKPIEALAGLETGVADELHDVHCGGGASFYGRYFRCHLKGGHGSVDLHRGIVQSCDVYFYNLGNRLGIDRIAEYAELCGLGKRTGIDLPHEAEGLVPSSRWKIRSTRQKWYAGETISVAIGQGALTVTPLQLAYAIGGLAMGGVWYTPHVVAGASPQENPRRANFNPENVAKVIYGMYGVVNEGGTGGRARVPGIEMCGKTGTAQLASNEVLKTLKGEASLKDNAWFVGFAPREFPEIVVVALVEGGLHGSTAAAPVARDIVKTYFDKKKNQLPGKLLARQQTSAAGGGTP
ncbi:MAG: penicillin-binding protein 2 [Acidobacteriales bacterium]|nr:MAG: penicillin-binding protein 2 [Terriglobales bacterium]